MLFRSRILLVAIGGAVALVALSVMTAPSTLPASAFAPRNVDLANGETMFNIGGCSSCHATPEQQDRLKLGGGTALRSPFGTFKVPNISPDPEAGIGAWSEL